MDRFPPLSPVPIHFLHGYCIRFHPEDSVMLNIHVVVYFYPSLGFLDGEDQDQDASEVVSEE